MGATAVTGPEAPEWEFLLAHHGPARYDRTIAFRVGGRRYRVCTRCTGQVLGAAALLGGILGSGELAAGLLTPPFQMAIAAFPLLAAVDWTTQALGRRESSTTLRLVSGALLGFASADLLALLVLRPWGWVAIGVGAAALYVATILATLRATGRWRIVVEEHLPGAAPFPPAR